MSRVVIVVPEGVAADRDGRSLEAVSFCYGAVLDFALRAFNDGSDVFLAPANCFGGAVSEQAAAADYLRGKWRGTVFAPVTEELPDLPRPARQGNLREQCSRKLKTLPRLSALRTDNLAYVDTRGNAALLRGFCEREGLVLPPVVLLAGYLHIRRARLCFEREGFAIRQAVGVRYVIPPDAFMPRRLWYYRHPWVHRVYEAGALVRDFFRN